MGSFCTNCLYDLEATTLPRCPECGCAFNPASRAATTLPTDSVVRWSLHHVRLFVIDWAGRHFKRTKSPVFCRACLSDLTAVRLAHQCPTCGQYFEISDSRTYLRSRHALARVYDRFRHVCIWRGVLLAGLVMIYGAWCVITQHAVLPGAGGRYHTGRLLPLEGLAAVLMGVAWLGAALALHARYFWGRVEPIWRFADLGVVLGVIAIIGGWGYALYSAFASFD